jgi:hypothetical protein
VKTLVGSHRQNGTKDCSRILLTNGSEAVTEIEESRITWKRPSSEVDEKGVREKNEELNNDHRHEKANKLDVILSE